MEQVQTVKITLSNGRVGFFYGAVLLPEDAPQDTKVESVEFSPPKAVSRIKFKGADE